MPRGVRRGNIEAGARCPVGPLVQDSGLPAGTVDEPKPLFRSALMTARTMTIAARPPLAVAES